MATYAGPSSKVKYLLHKLHNMKKRNASLPPDAIPHKAVVFTQWTNFADLVEIALLNKAINYTRMDGSMSLKARTKALDKFANERECIVFLATIGTGGVGLNLTAADAVFIMEPQWNPMVEQQAVDRVHRIGQTRPVFVARLIAKGTIERGIRESARQKEGLANLTLAVGGEGMRMNDMVDLFTRQKALGLKRKAGS